MAKKHFSTKRLAIEKANAVLVIAVSLATFIVVFCIFSSRALLDQRAYQAGAITKKRAALDTLDKNAVAAKQLAISHQEFASQLTNVLGGNSKGTADQDGENSRIVLDALPSKYDFPGLATSIQKLFADKGFAITDLTGNDDELAQSAGGAPAGAPAAVEIPFTVTSPIPPEPAKGKEYLNIFERSIRPMQIKKVSLTSGSGKITITTDAKTYWQSSKSLNIVKKPLK